MDTIKVSMNDAEPLDEKDKRGISFDQIKQAVGINRKRRNEAILSLQLWGILCKASAFKNNARRLTWNIAIGSDKFHAAANNQSTWVKETDMGRIVKSKVVIDLAFGFFKWHKEIRQGA